MPVAAEEINVFIIIPLVLIGKFRGTQPLKSVAIGRNESSYENHVGTIKV